MYHTVKDILESKGRDVWSIAPSQSVYDSVKLMIEKSVGALTVLDDSRLVGIISERDCARKLLLRDALARETSVEDVMTPEPDLITVREETSVDGCLARMARHKIRHLPVMEGEELVGIVSAVDVFKFIIRDQMETIEELESYVKEETGGSG